MIITYNLLKKNSKTYNPAQKYTVLDIGCGFAMDILILLLIFGV